MAECSLAVGPSTPSGVQGRKDELRVNFVYRRHRESLVLGPSARSVQALARLHRKNLDWVLFSDRDTQKVVDPVVRIALR
ncbi:hypothetical protein CY34DRAFT_715060 [Suillus luteus UH-Slu-Lm8-n1]|uniref:Uncharacterized protein n=1 Tax=Suillus luteus UH-Slu-Lm8-n1 TaxID=930992 RepID=A0A0D0BAS7_9AGAM|nr:hypothetical protein CY34DRAFT_715060 [Suillus luteus UH-Slu-Lm8-n1]